MSNPQRQIILDVLTKVDNFIRDLESGDLELSPEAKTMTLSQTTKGRLGQTIRKDRGSYLNSFGMAIADYKSSTFFNEKWEYAQECLKYIEWAYTHGIVLNKGLDKKLKMLEMENKQLKELTASAIAKTEDAHQLLFSLENKLRQFISDKIQEANGKIEESMIKDWEGAKRKEAQPQRKPINYELINYSTFDQLKKIIIQNENWEKIFRKYFRRQDGVISRINELDDIRDTIAHNRMLSVFDYDCFKTLYSEILNCIGRKENFEVGYH
jgi:hypothetical protein